LFLRFRQISACLIADNVEEITHRHVHVDEMQPPIRQEFTVDDQVSLDIAHARPVRDSVAAHGEVDDLAVLDAACAEEPGDLHERRVDRMRRIGPRDGFLRLGD
jgi:hypothetical protein